jgi:zeta-carotene desaturase
MEPGIVVLGGGVAGIAAATKLAQAGRSVTLIEKKPFLGGRTYSIQDRKTGDFIDNGQHLLMGCYHETFTLLTRLGTMHGVCLQPNLDIRYKSAQGWQDRLACPHLPGPFHLLAGLFGLKQLSFRDHWAALRFGLHLKAKKPAQTGETVTAFCQRLGQTQTLVHQLWEPICISALNEKPDVASAELFATVLQQAFFGKKQDSVLGFPALSLSTLLGDRAARYLEENNGNVIVKDRAVSLKREGEQLTAVQLQSGREIPCHACISALPASNLQTLLDHSGLQDRIHIPSLEYSPILSVFLWFERAFTNDEVCCLLDSEFEWVLFRSNFMQPGEHEKFCVCLLVSAASAFQSWKREALVELALKNLQTAYPESAGIEPVSSTVFWEPKATFSPAAAMSEQRPGPETGIDQFYLAGDWTGTGYPATIEGAALSGHRCADLVLEQKW